MIASGERLARPLEGAHPPGGRRSAPRPGTGRSQGGPAVTGAGGTRARRETPTPAEPPGAAEQPRTRRQRGCRARAPPARVPLTCPRRPTRRRAARPAGRSRPPPPSPGHGRHPGAVCLSVARAVPLAVLRRNAGGRGLGPYNGAGRGGPACSRGGQSPERGGWSRPEQRRLPRSRPRSCGDAAPGKAVPLRRAVRAPVRTPARPGTGRW